MCYASLQSHNACQQWLVVTLRALPCSLTPMINQLQEEHNKRCSLFGLISVMSVAKSCGCNVPWVSRRLFNYSSRFLLVTTVSENFTVVFLHIAML